MRYTEFVTTMSLRHPDIDQMTQGPMLLALDGSSEYVVHVWCKNGIDYIVDEFVVVKKYLE